MVSILFKNWNQNSFRKVKPSFWKVPTYMSPNSARVKAPVFLYTLLLSLLLSLTQLHHSKRNQTLNKKQELLALLLTDCERGFPAREKSPPARTRAASSERQKPPRPERPLCVSQAIEGGAFSFSWLLRSTNRRRLWTSSQTASYPYFRCCSFSFLLMTTGGSKERRKKQEQMKEWERLIYWLVELLICWFHVNDQFEGWDKEAGWRWPFFFFLFLSKEEHCEDFAPVSVRAGLE